VKLSVLLSGAAACALSLGAFGAEAQTMMGLTADGALVAIDSASRTAKPPVKVAGTDSRIIGIDVRPADGKLYAVSSFGSIYTIDLNTGAATFVSQLSERFDAGAAATADFNPVADRLRLIGASGVNFRVNVTDGKVAVDKPLNYDAADPGAGKKPNVVAGAYTNSFAGTKETALYDIDAAQGVVTLQAPPNDGVLKTKGKLGVAATPAAAFDILADGNGGNTGYLVVGNTLHSIDLNSGAATRIGTINGVSQPIVDVAIIPKAN
jgi:hypothetical protein